MSPLSPPSSSGSAASRADDISTGLGLKAMSCDPRMCTNTVAPGSQLLAVAAIGLNAGDTISNILFCLTVAASGTAPTLARAGIFDSTFALVASTADLHASAIWTATGYATAALSASYSPSVSGLYYAGFLKNGTWGTTQPSFLSGTTQTLAGHIISGSLRPWWEQTLQADLPNPATPANPTNAPIWVAVS